MLAGLSIGILGSIVICRSKQESEPGGPGFDFKPRGGVCL
jgi:hypothetical protein